MKNNIEEKIREILYKYAKPEKRVDEATKRVADINLISEDEFIES